ncbi:kinase-like domain-containing protein [Phyllosticta capitalensis]
MVPSFPGHGSSTMTPPATPPTVPRSNQAADVPQRSLHSPLTSPVVQTTLSQPLLPLSSSTSSSTSRDSNQKMATMAIRVSADGVWENSTGYTLTNDAPLGVGAWSSVHLAIPSEDRRSISTRAAAADTPPATPVGRSAQGFSKLTVSPPSRQSAGAAGGPPPQPHQQQQPGFASLNSVKTGKVWAIKAPTNKTAQTVIRAEAHILSRIFSWRPQPKKPDYFVPFHGLDPQTGSLIMDALPLTLDDFINEDLATLQEPSRSTLVAQVLPSLVTHLLQGLDWLHHEAGVVHADIKPSNILLRPSRPAVAAAMLQRRLQSASSFAVGASLAAPSLLRSTADALNGDVEAPEKALQQVSFTPLYTDFSAALSLRPDAPVSAPSSSDTNTTPPLSPTQAAGPVDSTPSSTPTTTSSPPSPIAAGTWDFLAPELCRTATPPPVPTPSSDVYALGITFLILLTGHSPFDAVAQGNAIRRREMIRAGDAVAFAGMEQRGARALREVGRRMAGEGGEGRLRAWLRPGLERGVERRVEARAWGVWWVGEFGDGVEEVEGVER